MAGSGQVAVRGGSLVLGALGALVLAHWSSPAARSGASSRAGSRPLVDPPAFGRISSLGLLDPASGLGDQRGDVERRVAMLILGAVFRARRCVVFVAARTPRRPQRSATSERVVTQGLCLGPVSELMRGQSDR